MFGCILSSDAGINRQKTWTVTKSLATWILWFNRATKQQCKNYPKIHGQTSGAVAPSPPEYATDTYNGWPIDSRIWSIEWRHFQWLWTTHTPNFKVTPFFDAEYFRNGTRYRHSFNEILIRIYSTVSFRMILSNLEQLSNIFNDTKHRAVSPQQLSFLFHTPLAFDAPIEKFPVGLLPSRLVRKKTRMVGLPDGEKTLRIYITV